MMQPEDSILLVEDDDVDVMQVRRAFTKRNIKNPLYVAGDGLAALELLRSDTFKTLPKVVLLDINMPRMNGIEFLREVRKDPRLQQLYIFVLTTSADDKDVINAYKFNVAGYILKPVTFQKFLDAVDCLEHYWHLNQMPTRL